ncbi:MAG: hypothetical protein ACLGJC_16400 [Alphaproteobacteria bacterium]
MDTIDLCNDWFLVEEQPTPSALINKARRSKERYAKDLAAILVEAATTEMSSEELLSIIEAISKHSDIPIEVMNRLFVRASCSPTGTAWEPSTNASLAAMSLALEVPNLDFFIERELALRNPESMTK